MTGQAKAGGGAGDAKRVGTNRKAFRDYHILDRFEAGLELRGTEVKSLRAAGVSLAGSYARIENKQVILYDLHISPYEHGNRFNHDPVRPRRLLLHAREIHRLFGQVTVKGRALVPLSIYFRRGFAKVELGLCTGKNLVDKRETLRRKTQEREAIRAIRER